MDNNEDVMSYYRNLQPEQSGEALSEYVVDEGTTPQPENDENATITVYRAAYEGEMREVEFNPEVLADAKIYKKEYFLAENDSDNTHDYASCPDGCTILHFFERDADAVKYAKSLNGDYDMVDKYGSTKVYEFTFPREMYQSGIGFYESGNSRRAYTPREQKTQMPEGIVCFTPESGYDLKQYHTGQQDVPFKREVIPYDPDDYSCWF